MSSNTSSAGGSSPAGAYALSPSSSDGRSSGNAPRRRGRPPMRTPAQVLEEIRAAAQSGKLFRVHLDQPALYARARRMWGTWAAALREAGVDYHGIVQTARTRALETRRTKRERREA